MGRKLELIYEDEEANPAVATQKAEKLFQVNKVDFLTGTVNSRLAPWRWARWPSATTADRDHGVLRRQHHRRQVQPQRLPRQCPCRHAERGAGRLDGHDAEDANVFYLGPDYEMGRSTVAAFKSAAEGKGAKTVGEVFAPLDNKDYSPYFGQIRGARRR
jgi:branched-chain amino acid transport system substrate-binding protein